MNKITELSEALKEAYDFVDCDKGHSNREIANYAQRVCKQIKDSLTILANNEVIESPTKVNVAQPLTVQELCEKFDTIQDPKMETIERLMVNAFNAGQEKGKEIAIKKLVDIIR